MWTWVGEAPAPASCCSQFLRAAAGPPDTAECQQEPCAWFLRGLGRGPRSTCPSGESNSVFRAAVIILVHVQGPAAFWCCSLYQRHLLRVCTTCVLPPGLGFGLSGSPCSTSVSQTPRGEGRCMHTCVPFRLCAACCVKLWRLYQRAGRCDQLIPWQGSQRQMMRYLWESKMSLIRCHYCIPFLRHGRHSLPFIQMPFLENNQQSGGRMRGFVHQPLFLDVNTCSFWLHFFFIVLIEKQCLSCWISLHVFVLTQNSQVSENCDSYCHSHN